MPFVANAEQIARTAMHAIAPDLAGAYATGGSTPVAAATALLEGAVAMGDCQLDRTSSPKGKR